MTTSNTIFLNPAMTHPLSTGTVKTKVGIVPLRDAGKCLIVWPKTIKNGHTWEDRTKFKSY